LIEHREMLIIILSSKNILSFKFKRLSTTLVVLFLCRTSFIYNSRGGKLYQSAIKKLQCGTI